MKKIISLIAAIGLTTSMYANDNTGCGLGSLVIKDQSTVMLQVLAATTNGTSGSQTFGPNKSIVQFLLFTCKKISIFSE